MEWASLASSPRGEVSWGLVRSRAAKCNGFFFRKGTIWVKPWLIMVNNGESMDNIWIIDDISG